MDDLGQRALISFLIFYCGIHFEILQIYLNGGNTADNPVWGMATGFLWFEACVLLVVIAGLICIGLFKLNSCDKPETPYTAKVEPEPQKPIDYPPPIPTERHFAPPPPTPTPETVKIPTVEELEQEAISQILKGY